MTDTSNPNLFIVGAPKCATTSMHDYLAQHPDVHMSVVKEPRFLSTDIEDRIPGRITEAHDYFNLFTAGAGKRYRGESSVWYLYSDVACRSIGELAEDPRIIVMIRNPVDFIQSLHGQFCYSLNETERDITKALALEQTRAAGKRVPWETHTPLGLQYRRTAHFADRIEHYFQQHGRERVHVIIFDDLVTDTIGVYQDVLRFLDLPPIALVPAMKNRAADRLPMNVVSGRLLKLSGGRNIARKIPGPLRRAIRAGLDRLFGHVNMNTQPMPAALRAQLTTEFHGEVERLGKLLCRDLSHWARLS
jgi:hypothetical protein